VLLALAALLAPAVAAQGPLLTRGPYLQSTTRDSTIVVWQTETASDSVVEYGETGYTQVVSSTAQVTTHVVSLTGLSAGTTYQYRIGSGSTLLYTSTITTAPDPGGAFDFVMVGDSGQGANGIPTQELLDVAAQMDALDPDFVLHLGDVIYPEGGAENYQPYFFNPYQNLLDSAPIFPSLGNHDYLTSDAQPYLDVFYLPANNPAGTERYYSFDWSDAHFVALDSNRLYPIAAVTDTAMLDWLATDLASSTAAWKFVYFHHAPYSSGPHGWADPYVEPMRTTLVPVFEQYDVDMVFAGHDHDYERTKPINGVIYIVSGGGGANTYPVFPRPFSAYAESVHHTVQVQIDGCILSLRAIDKDSVVIDQIAMAKCSNRLYLPILLKS
jgi:hypothetical protein